MFMYGWGANTLPNGCANPNNFIASWRKTSVIWSRCTPLMVDFLYVSPSYTRTRGYTEAELLSMPIEALPSLVHPDDLVRTQKEAHQQVLRGSRVTKLEYRCAKKDGTYFWVETNSTPIFDDNGQVIQLLASARDITERKKTEVTLAQSENRYRQMFDSNRAIKLVSMVNTGEIIEANAAAVKFYGYSLEQLKSMRIQDLNTLSEEKVAFEIEKSRVQHRSFFEMRHRLASRQVRDVDVFLSPLETLDGSFLYSIVMDANGKREAELRYRSLFEQSNDAVFILDLAGNHLQANQRAAEMLGYSAEEIINLSYRDLVVPDQHSQSNNVLQSLLAAGKLSRLMNVPFGARIAALCKQKLMLKLYEIMMGTSFTFKALCGTSRSASRWKHSCDTASPNSPKLSALHSLETGIGM